MKEALPQKIFVIRTIVETIETAIEQFWTVKLQEITGLDYNFQVCPKNSTPQFWRPQLIGLMLLG